MKIISFTEEGREIAALISEVDVIHPPLSRSDDIEKTEELVLVTPHRPTTTEKNLQEVHRIWQELCSCKNKSTMNLWREISPYGAQMIYGSKLFKLRGTSLYFYLINENDTVIAASHLIDCIWTLKSIAHYRKNRIVLHAAGVVHHKDAFLFLGHSGAGKSTAARNSSSRGEGWKVIHDDHVVVMRDSNGKYLVTDFRFKKDPYPLKSVFLLHQDVEDYVIPLSQKEAVKSLQKSCKEIFAAPLLHGQYLKQVFSTIADMARTIPCFILHLRNHPEFWDVIEAELGKN